jgi:hypothetical protein
MMMFRKINISSLLVLLLAIIATSFLVEADKNETMSGNETSLGDDAFEEDLSLEDDDLEVSSSFTVAVSASALVVVIISMINLN